MAKILVILEKSVSLLSGVVQHISSGIPSNFSQALTVIAVLHCPAYQTVNFQPLQECDIIGKLCNNHKTYILETLKEEGHP